VTADVEDYGRVGYQRLGSNPTPLLRPGGTTPSGSRGAPIAPAQQPPSAPGIPPEIAAQAAPTFDPNIEVTEEDLAAVPYAPRTPEDAKFAKEVAESPNISALPPASKATGQTNAKGPTRAEVTERISVDPPQGGIDVSADIDDSVAGSYDWNPDAPRGRATADTDAAQYSKWVVAEKDNGGKPYVVADKQKGKVYLFDKGGDLIAESPALFGRAIGDAIPERFLDRNYKPTEAERRNYLQITPSGRFDTNIVETSSDYEREGYGMAWIDFANLKLNKEDKGWMTAFHQEYGPEKTRRSRLLKTPTPDDNRASGGCVNLPKHFHDNILLPALSQGGVAYIMPEDEDARAAAPQFN